MTAGTTIIPVEDIKPGHIIVFLGHPHLISEIEPYKHDAFPEAFGIARAADGWGYSLHHGSDVIVAAP